MVLPTTDGVDVETGEIQDVHHDLCSENMADKVLSQIHTGDMVSFEEDCIRISRMDHRISSGSSWLR